MKRWLLVLGLAALVAGCKSEAHEPAGTAAAAGAAKPAAQVFPLLGDWVWSGGAPALPTRNVGCARDETRLKGEPSALVLTNGTWRQPAFGITDWHRAGNRLELGIEDNSLDGRRKFAVTLDISHPDHTSVIALEAGAGVAHSRELDQRMTALREVFTLARCQQGLLAASALMRGSDGKPVAEVVARSTKTTRK